MSLTELPERTVSSEKSGPTAPIRIGNAVFDPKARILEANNVTHQLEPRLADLLMRLASAGEPVSRDDLLNDIWGQDGSDEALTQAISKLRRALGDEQRPYRVIATIPKFGYELDRDALEASAAPVVITPSLAVAFATHISTRRDFYKGLATGIGLMLVAVVAYALANPPKLVEREMILCPPGAPEGECAAMLERP